MPINFFTVILITGFIHGIALLIAINRIKDKNKQANKFLSLLVALISIALIGRITYEPEILQINFKLAMLPDFILFLFGPFTYFYFKALLTTEDNALNKIWKHFIPAGLHVFYFLFMFTMDYDEFTRRAEAGDFFLPIHTVLMTSLIQNSFYWFLSFKLFRRYNSLAQDNVSYLPRSRFIFTLLGILAICLTVWLVSEILTLFPFQKPDFATIGYVWIALTFLIYVLGFYAISQPELFRISLQSNKYQSSRLKSSDIENYKGQLEELMQSQKLYKNPKLSKLDLEEILQLNSAEISRIINEGFGKNFFDYVNSHRISEFLELVQQQTFSNYTYLAIAKEAGFNSKTTFNTAFKKLTGQTPKMYIDRHIIKKEVSIGVV